MLSDQQDPIDAALLAPLQLWCRERGLAMRAGVRGRGFFTVHASGPNRAAAIQGFFADLTREWDSAAEFRRDMRTLEWGYGAPPSVVELEGTVTVQGNARFLNATAAEKKARRAARAAAAAPNVALPEPRVQDLLKSVRRELRAARRENEALRATIEDLRAQLRATRPAGR